MFLLLFTFSSADGGNIDLDHVDFANIHAMKALCTNRVFCPSDTIGRSVPLSKGGARLLDGSGKENGNENAVELIFIAEASAVGGGGGDNAVSFMESVVRAEAVLKPTRLQIEAAADAAPSRVIETSTLEIVELNQHEKVLDEITRSGDRSHLLSLLRFPFDALYYFRLLLFVFAFEIQWERLLGEKRIGRNGKTKKNKRKCSPSSSLRLALLLLCSLSWGVVAADPCPLKLSFIKAGSPENVNVVGTVGLNGSEYF